jgi:hypothetical protein
MRNIIKDKLFWKAFSACALFSAILWTTALSVVGCKNTSPQGVIYTTEGTAITAVDTGMKAWHDWVVAGKATQAQVDTVKTAYQSYYAAQQVAKAALEKYIVATSTNSITASSDAQRANQSVADAEQALVSIINSFINKSTTKPL